MRLERIEKMGEEMVEVLPQVTSAQGIPHHSLLHQAYMDCYELSLVQGEEEIAKIFAHRLITYMDLG